MAGVPFENSLWLLFDYLQRSGIATFETNGPRGAKVHGDLWLLEMVLRGSDGLIVRWLGF